ncbi:hypothetical protein [Streptomyces sp.]|nr:hypothetical protein [Streptomyces sp.]HET6358338.1 hypothetical protein [Streptomyces sp.]
MPADRAGHRVCAKAELASPAAGAGGRTSVGPIAADRTPPVDALA